MRCIEAWTVFQWVQVMVTDYQGTGVTPRQFLEQYQQGLFLRLCTCVGGLTADIKPALIAHTNGMFVVVLAFDVTMGAYHPFRTALLHYAVTPDDVVVADAEFPALLPVPGVYLGC